MMMMVMMMLGRGAAAITHRGPLSPVQVTWTLNDCPITGQEYQRGHLQYVLGGSGNRHTLDLPVTSMMQAGRVAITAENTVGRAVSAAALRVIGEYPRLGSDCTATFLTAPRDHSGPPVPRPSAGPSTHRLPMNDLLTR